MAKVLISVPDLSIPGGVANIYKSIKWNDLDQVYYFYNTTPNALSKIWFIPVMFIRFCIIIRNVQLVQLNPSLNLKALIRDGILVLLSKLLNKQVIVFFHGWDEELELVISKNILYRKMFLLVFNKVDAFFLLGTTFKKKLFDLGIANNNVYYMPTIADDSNYLRTVKKKPNRKTLLFISRFVPAKGMDVVLKAFHCLQTKFGRFDFDLIMAGDGPELNKSIHYVALQKIPNVRFTGYIDGVAKHNCYSNADFLFFPSSYSEGLPCVIMEAMLYGLVVITRPVGGIPDWITHNVNGWLSESTEAAVFAEGIIALAKNPQMMQDIRENNRAIAKAHFTPKSFKHQMQSIHREVLNEKYRAK